MIDANKPLNIDNVKTYSIHDRKSLVTIDNFATPCKKKQSFSKEEQDKWAKEKNKKEFFTENGIKSNTPQNLQTSLTDPEELKRPLYVVVNKKRPTCEPASRGGIHF